MSFRVFSILMVVCAASMHAQSGPCTEVAVNNGNLSTAPDAFAYMPPYGKPVVGKSEINGANKKSFSDRTNIKRSWAADHRVEASPSGDMAYERGTMQMSYDSKSEGHREFKAVVLIVYKAKAGSCQQVALTMQPLEEESKR